MHDKLNASKGVVRSRELFLATLKDLKTTLEKQEVSDFKRIIITGRKEILTIDKLAISKEVKIGYCLKKTKNNHSHTLEVL